MNAAMTLCAISSVCPGWEGVNLAQPLPRLQQDWFDAQQHLGKRGHRFLSIATKLALAAAQQFNPSIKGGPAIGLYLGTASADTRHRVRTVQALRRDPIALPGAASAPQASANSLAGTLARKFGITGPVMTLTGGDDSGLIGLWQAASAMARGEISGCVVGQVEDTVQDPAAGAILWSLTREPQAHGVTCLEFCGWKRLPDEGRFEALADLIGQINGPVTLISQPTAQLGELARQLRNTRSAGSEIEFISGEPAESALAPDMYLFGLLSLEILDGRQGCILILSRHGHLFILTVKPKGAYDA